jgi:Protein of unknown function (DUF3501)
MEPIRREEIEDLTAYERMRPEFRKKIIALRRDRRITAGDRLSIMFENRETVLYQIQEMLRAERIVDESAIRHELDTYNEILPKPQSLAGTLFIELTESDRIREELEEFLGLDRGEHVWFDLGPAGRAVARFSEGQSEDGRISSVQYVQFPFTPEGAAFFRDPSQPADLVVEHPNYRVRVAVEGVTRRSLAADLA